MRKFLLSIVILLTLAAPVFSSGVFTRSESDYLSLADGSWANLVTTGTANTGWTIAMWVKPATMNQSSTTHYYWTWTDGTYYRRLKTPETTVTGATHFCFDYKYGSSGSMHYDDVSYSTKPSTSEWRHFAITSRYDAANGIYHKFWLNGSNTYSPSGLFVAGGSTLNPTTIYIGALDGPAYGLNGKIAEIAMWPRILTQTELQKLSGTGGYTKTRVKNLESPSTYSMYLPLYSSTREATDITVTNNGVTFDTSDDPFPGDDPYGVLNVHHYFQD